MIEVYSPFGIWHVFFNVLTPISTTSGLWSTGITRKYQQIDVYINQCDDATYKTSMRFALWFQTRRRFMFSLQASR